MRTRANEDGRLWRRVIAAAIPAGVSLAISIGAFAIMFCSDSKTVDAKTADAITRIERRIDTVEAEAREARRAAAEDRQKIAEMAAELRSTSRGVSRIEALLDTMMMERASKPPRIAELAPGDRRAGVTGCPPWAFPPLTGSVSLARGRAFCLLILSALALGVKFRRW